MRCPISPFVTNFPQKGVALHRCIPFCDKFSSKMCCPNGNFPHFLPRPRKLVERKIESFNLYIKTSCTLTLLLIIKIIVVDLLIRQMCPRNQFSLTKIICWRGGRGSVSVSILHLFSTFFLSGFLYITYLWADVIEGVFHCDEVF